MASPKVLPRQIGPEAHNVQGETNRNGSIWPQKGGRSRLTGDCNCLMGSYREGSIQLFWEVPSRRVSAAGSQTTAKDVPVETGKMFFIGMGVKRQIQLPGKHLQPLHLKMYYFSYFYLTLNKPLGYLPDLPWTNVLSAQQTSHSVHFWFCLKLAACFITENSRFVVLLIHMAVLLCIAYHSLTIL